VRGFEKTWSARRPPFRRKIGAEQPIDVKTFLRFFYFGRVLNVFNFFIFQTFFILKKTLAKFRAAFVIGQSELLSDSV